MWKHWGALGWLWCQPFRRHNHKDDETREPQIYSSTAAQFRKALQIPSWWKFCETIIRDIQNLQRTQKERIAPRVLLRIANSPQTPKTVIFGSLAQNPRHHNRPWHISTTPKEISNWLQIQSLRWKATIQVPRNNIDRIPPKRVGIAWRGAQENLTWLRNSAYLRVGRQHTDFRVFGCFN